MSKDQQKVRWTEKDPLEMNKAAMKTMSNLCLVPKGEH